MTIKQKVHKQSVTTILFAGLIFGFAFLGAPIASADPMSTQVTCNDGKKVTARKDDAVPADILNDADFEEACKRHDGYKKIDETIVCKDGSGQNVYKDLADPKNKLDDKDRKEACNGHGGVKPPEEPEEDPGDGSTGSCGGAETSIIKCDADNSGGIENNGVWALLLMAINILTAGIGIAAVGGIVYGSILYTTAGDNESQIKTAKEVIRNVIIGVIAYIAMFALLQFIIPGGVFS